MCQRTVVPKLLAIGQGIKTAKPKISRGGVQIDPPPPPMPFRVNVVINGIQVKQVK